MNVIDLLEEKGINPRKTATTKGGEYHSTCPDPFCAGKDRFCVWPSEGPDGRYWCRKCLRSGDAIQFCRDFMGMDFLSACAKVGRQSTHLTMRTSARPKERFIPKLLLAPSEKWRQRASNFVQRSHQYLLRHPHLLNQDKDRGLTQKSIIDFHLGWNPTDIFESRQLWGLSDMSTEGGAHLLCLPQGIVIPSFREDIPIRVKIRRHNWIPDAGFPKYHIISGGMTCPALYGDASKPVVIVEAELDAMLIQQLAADNCCCIALGGVTIRPDVFVDRMLCQCQCILYALDFDEAGKKAFFFWQATYTQLRPWPVPKGKSQGDAFKDHGIDLSAWIKQGILRSPTIDKNN